MKNNSQWTAALASVLVLVMAFGVPVTVKAQVVSAQNVLVQSGHAATVNPNAIGTAQDCAFYRSASGQRLNVRCAIWQYSGAVYDYEIVVENAITISGRVNTASNQTTSLAVTWNGQTKSLASHGNHATGQFLKTALSSRFGAGFWNAAHGAFRALRDDLNGGPIRASFDRDENALFGTADLDPRAQLAIVETGMSWGCAVAIASLGVSVVAIPLATGGAGVVLAILSQKLAVASFVASCAEN